MNVAEVLKKEHIALGLSAASKEEVLEKLIDLLYKNGALSDKKAFTEDVMERERVSSTGIGNSIAIPHGKSANVIETTAAIARLEKPITWSSADGEPVSFVVLLAVNENDKGVTHVKLLSQMARKLASEETCKRLMDAADADEVIGIFSE